MKNEYVLIRPALHFALMPHTTPALFRHLFDVAAKRWPGKKLTYIGTDDDGNHYMQEPGNKEPFVLAGMYHP